VNESPILSDVSPLHCLEASGEEVDESALLSDFSDDIESSRAGVFGTSSRVGECRPMTLCCLLICRIFSHLDFCFGMVWAISVMTAATWCGLPCGCHGIATIAVIVERRAP